MIFICANLGVIEKNLTKLWDPLVRETSPQARFELPKVLREMENIDLGKIKNRLDHIADKESRVTSHRMLVVGGLSSVVVGVVAVLMVIVWCVRKRMRGCVWTKRLIATHILSENDPCRRSPKVTTNPHNTDVNCDEFQSRPALYPVVQEEY